MFSPFATQRVHLPDFPKPPVLYTYPVLRERCACGAFTETVAADTDTTNAFFAAWRADHYCPSRRAAHK